jgi:hypothetical protein
VTLRSTFSAIHRAEFFILGGMLIAVAGVAYLFARPAFDFNFLFAGMCSIAIGVLERNRKLQNKGKRRWNDSIER